MTDRNVQRKKVLILSTGGTLGMSPVAGGTLRPDKILTDLLTWVPELHAYAEVSLEILVDLDSSLVGPDHWLTMARRIATAQDRGDCAGIVVLHGTDTLAYSASALSFLLAGLEIPVVLTGGQKPLTATRTDARNNIIGAVESALEGPVEVMVFFHNKAYRGNRATKVAIGDFDGFDSPNFPALGYAGIEWSWRSEHFWPQTRRPSIWPEIPKQLPPTPWVLPWVPGLGLEPLLPAFSGHWAIILEAFGTGNLPLSEAMQSFFADFIAGGGLVFLNSQVPHGRVIMDAYELGQRMKGLGIVGVADMTREALVTKLMVLRALGMDKEKLKLMITHSLAGEVSK